MTVESGIENPGVYIDTLDDTYPASGDILTEGDNHLRGIKNCILNTFPSVTGAITSTHTELNVLDGIPATLTATELGYVDGVTSAIQTQLDAKAPSNDWATGTKTFPNVLTVTADQDNAIAHGLGTDDIDFGMKIVGSVNGLVQGSMVDTNGYAIKAIGNGDADLAIGTATLPAAGNLSIRVRNQHTGTQDIVVHWWARKR